MSKGDRENMGTDMGILDIHLGGETHFDLRCLTVVEKSVTNKCQSKNSTPATPCLCKHNREHAFYTPTAALEVILMIFILRERQGRRLTDLIVLENLLEQVLAIRRFSKR
jgi:hypothetical protein